MRIHLIAIGGSAMHNLALELASTGHVVTGSDDEIYEPSRSRLAHAGILPEHMGWDAGKITTEIDVVILGMHARKDNPELIRAVELGLNVVSYPEFIYQSSRDKKRIVIAGSHGKTTTTGIILHVLKKLSVDVDYLVGAQLQGFDRMVRLTDAPVIILEGDEYLSSPIDSRSKFSHYRPHVSVITGIAWDHINVFPTETDYVQRFRDYVDDHEDDAVLYYYEGDEQLADILGCSHSKCKKIGYGRLKVDDSSRVVFDGESYNFPLIGDHNLENAHAALCVCRELGVSDRDFFTALEDFTGAGKRLQKIYEGRGAVGYLDFAHAPSKVKATTEAVKKWYPGKKMIAVLELHTFSSLNAAFLPTYRHSLSAADEAYVFYDAHTLAMKKMPPLDERHVAQAFNQESLKIITNKAKLHDLLDTIAAENTVLLLMTSGNFAKYDFNKLSPW